MLFGVAHAVKQTEPTLAVVLNSGDATVSLVDMKTRAVTKTIPIGKEPHHVMLTPDEKTLLIANAMGNDIALMNPLTGDVTGHIPKIIDPYHIGYSPNNRWFITAANRLDRVDIYSANGADLK
jgi:YVTN family beta-propeller protein